MKRDCSTIVMAAVGLFLLMFLLAGFTLSYFVTFKGDDKTPAQLKANAERLAAERIARERRLAELRTRRDEIMKEQKAVMAQRKELFAAGDKEAAWQAADEWMALQDELRLVTAELNSELAPLPPPPE